MTMFELLKALKEKHKLLDKNVKLLEKSRVTDRSDETWEVLRELKKDKLTTRDSRVVERKKYGHRKARRSFQFSKR